MQLQQNAYCVPFFKKNASDATSALWPTAPEMGRISDEIHMQTPAPSRKDVENVRAFFSGHYQTYGVNVQASCDHNCRFGFIGVAGPGVMGDREALNQVSIGKMIENLRGVYCVIGDCAYTPTEHLVPIFRGENSFA